MAEIHAARRARAQEKIAEAGADAALITSGPNVRYLTGLASSNAALLLAADGPRCWPRTRDTRWPPSGTAPTSS